MSLPSYLRLGASEYEVRKHNRHKLELLGHTENNDSIITIAKQQSGSSARDTLLHEVLHAILWLAGISAVLNIKHDEEEKLVRMLSPWLVAALRDNPELIAFLTDEKEIKWHE